MSEIPAKATESEDPSDGARSQAAADAVAPQGDAMWQSSPPGSIYDYIKVASFSIGPDGLVDQLRTSDEYLVERAAHAKVYEVSFERPRSVDFVQTLPRTPTGKVLKRVLREPYWVGHGRRVSGA